MSLATFPNIALRVVVSISAAAGVGYYWTNLNSAALFMVFQVVFIGSLCTAPLPWSTLIFEDRVARKQDELSKELGAVPMKLTAAHIKTAIDLGKILQGSVLERLFVVKALCSFAGKKREKFQEALLKSLVPLALTVTAIILLSIAAAKFLPPVAEDPAIHLIVSLAQAYVSTLTFLWTMGMLWGEVELHREVMRSVL